jgi:hypothetical protein
MAKRYAPSTTSSSLDCRLFSLTALERRIRAADRHATTNHKNKRYSPAEYADRRSQRSERERVTGNKG